MASKAGPERNFALGRPERSSKSQLASFSVVRQMARVEQRTIGGLCALFQSCPKAPASERLQSELDYFRNSTPFLANEKFLLTIAEI